MKLVLVSVLSFSLGFGAAVLNTKPTPSTHVCATVKGAGLEIVIDSAVIAHTEDGAILSAFPASELPKILKDDSLTFHACQ